MHNFTHFLLPFFLFLEKSSAAPVLQRYKCYATCLVQCESTKSTCENECAKYNNAAICENEQCWQTCDGSVPLSTHNYEAPTDFKIVSHLPWNITLSWTHRNPEKAYLLQFRANRFDDWKTYDEVIFSPTSGSETVRFAFPKAALCMKYSFRLAGVLLGGSTNFTEPLETDLVKPVFTSENTALSVAEAWESGPGKLRAKVVFTIPDGWKLYDELTPKIEFMPLDCPSGPMSEQSFVKDRNVAIFEISNCSGTFIMGYMETKCGESVPISLGVIRPVLLDPSNCSLFKNASFCAPNGQPACARSYDCISEFNFTHSDRDLQCASNTSNIPIQWDANIVPYTSPNCQPREYLIRWGQGLESKDDSIFGEATMNMRVEIGRKIVPIIDEAYTIPNVELGQKVIVQTCILYREPRVSQINRDLNIASRKVIDLKVSFCDSAHKASTKLFPLIIALPIALVVLIASASLFCIIRKTQKDHKRVRNMQLYLAEQRYTDIPLKPEVADFWELDRRSLLVYEEETLGKGAFGKVFKGKVLGQTITDPKSKSSLQTVREESLDMLVAVKQCYEFADDATKKDFLQEIELMKRLYYHPRIVNILHCITASEPLSLIVEFCPYGDLLHFLRSRRKYMVELVEKGVDLEAPGDSADPEMLINFKTVVQMCFQICDGMEYVSQKGFLHRDLAARNILVQSPTSVKIGDFGLTRFIESSTSLYVAKGGKLPIKWMALEAVETFEFSTKSDVWSFGVVLFEILTLGGVPYPDIMPLDGDFRRDILAFLRSGQRMEKPDNCTDELYEIMKATWAAEPEKRPSFTEIKEDLRKMVEVLSDQAGDMYIDPNRNYYNCKESTDPDCLQESAVSMEPMTPRFELGPTSSIGGELRKKDSGLGDENSFEDNCSERSPRSLDSEVFASPGKHEFTNEMFDYSE